MEGTDPQARVNTASSAAERASEILAQKMNLAGTAYSKSKQTTLTGAFKPKPPAPTSSSSAASAPASAPSTNGSSSSSSSSSSSGNGTTAPAEPSSTPKKKKKHNPLRKAVVHAMRELQDDRHKRAIVALFEAKQPLLDIKKRVEEYQEIEDAWAALKEEGQKKAAPEPTADADADDDDAGDDDEDDAEDAEQEDKGEEEEEGDEEEEEEEEEEDDEEAAAAAPKPPQPKAKPKAKAKSSSAGTTRRNTVLVLHRGMEYSIKNGHGVLKAKGKKKEPVTWHIYGNKSVIAIEQNENVAQMTLDEMVVAGVNLSRSQVHYGDHEDPGQASTTGTVYRVGNKLFHIRPTMFGLPGGYIERLLGYTGDLGAFDVVKDKLRRRANDSIADTLALGDYMRAMSGGAVSRVSSSPAPVLSSSSSSSSANKQPFFVRSDDAPHTRLLYDVLRTNMTVRIGLRDGSMGPQMAVNWLHGVQTARRGVSPEADYMGIVEKYNFLQHEVHWASVFFGAALASTKFVNDLIEFARDDLLQASAFVDNLPRADFVESDAAKKKRKTTADGDEAKPKAAKKAKTKTKTPPPAAPSAKPKKKKGPGSALKKLHQDVERRLKQKQKIQAEVERSKRAAEKEAAAAAKPQKKKSKTSQKQKKQAKGNAFVSDAARGPDDDDDDDDDDEFDDDDHAFIDDGPEPMAMDEDEDEEYNPGEQEDEEEEEDSEDAARREFEQWKKKKRRAARQAKTTKRRKIIDDDDEDDDGGADDVDSDEYSDDLVETISGDEDEEEEDEEE